MAEEKLTKNISLKNEAQLSFQTLMNNYLNSLASMQPSEWSKDARDWCQKHGIITNVENAQWKRFATREELVALLYKFEDLIDDNALNNSQDI